jgi:biotin operon repressor
LQEHCRSAAVLDPAADLITLDRQTTLWSPTHDPRRSHHVLHVEARGIAGVSARQARVSCHPTDDPQSPPSGTPDISFYCDDIAKTVAELKAKGVEFVDDVQNHGYGLVTHIRMPGDFQVQLYQPLYKK